MSDHVVYTRIASDADTTVQRFLWCRSGEWRLSGSLRLSDRPILRHDIETMAGVPESAWKRHTDNAGTHFRFLCFCNACLGVFPTVGCSV